MASSTRASRSPRPARTSQHSPSMQGDLFGTPPPSGPGGPAVMHDIITVAEEHALLAALHKLELQRFRFQQWEGNRQTKTFGWKYDFGAGTFEPAEAILDFLLPLRERAAAFAGIDASLLVQALVTLYEPGAGIGWHRDRPEFEDVIGISLGAVATMRFRRRLPDGKFQRLAVVMAPRSAYHLAGEIRHEWEHSIAPMKERRWSVTFRRLSARGLARERDLTSSAPP